MTDTPTLHHALPRPTTAARRVTTNLALAAAGAALVAVCAQVSFTVPWTPVPYTLQTFGVLIAAGALGAQLGVLSLVMYLTAGVAGLGVFSDGSSGWDALSGPSGGYLIGFVLSAVILGALADRGWITEVRSSITAMLTALVITFVVGVLWLMADLDVSGARALELGLYPFVPGEVIKLYAAGILLPPTTRLAGRLRA